MQLLWNNEVTDDERRTVCDYVGHTVTDQSRRMGTALQFALARGGGYGSTMLIRGIATVGQTGAGKVLPRYEVAIFDTEDQLLPAGRRELVIGG